eukprot:575379-Ditylum_brightwellii.AAC.2
MVVPLCETCNHAQMKAYHYPFEASHHQLHIATKMLEAQFRVTKSHWAHCLAYNCMEYYTDPIKA